MDRSIVGKKANEKNLHPFPPLRARKKERRREEETKERSGRARSVRGFVD